MTMKLLVALQANDTVLLQISEDDHALAHIVLDRKEALDICEKLKTLALKIKSGNGK